MPPGPIRVLREWIHRLYGTLTAYRSDQDLDAELRLHTELAADAARRRGLAAGAAARAAAIAAGGRMQAREALRDQRGLPWLDDLARDARFGVVQLRRNPAFSVVAIGTLALVIGAATAIFTVVHAVLLRPLSYPDADRLVTLWELPPDRARPAVTSFSNFLDWQDRGRSFETMAAFTRRPMNLLGGDEPVQVTGLAATAGFFDVLGVGPALGRTFAPREDEPGAAPVIVLTHGFWQRRFGARADIIGLRISVNATLHEIVGVMPPHFSFPDGRVQAFAPLRDGQSGGRSYSVIARLRSPVSVAAAADEMVAIAARTAEARPEMNANWSATAVPLHEHLVGDVRRPLLVLFAAVGFVLLIACTNIATLLMIRASARAREFRVRLALGAGRPRLVHQVLIESLVVAGAGAALGVVLAWLAVRLLVRTAPAALGIPRLDQLSIDPWVLLFVLGVTGVATLLFGVGPAIACSRSDQRLALASSSRSIAPGQRRVQRTLVVAQIALAVPLLAGAGLMVQSLYRLSRVDPGFRAEGVLTVRMLLLPVRNRTMHAEFVADALTRIRALPGVLAAGSIARLPLDGGNTASWYYRADRPEPPRGQRPSGDISIVTPGYFAAMGIPLLKGRDFDHRDRIGSPPVALLNATAARRFFGADDPIGRRLKVSWNDAREVEIIGVVGDIRHTRLDREPQPCLFMTNDQQPFPLSALVVRTAGDPQALATSVKRAIGSVRADQGLGAIETMSDLVGGAMAPRKLQAALFSAFGVLALVLTSLGVYGVLAYAVSQRRRELGVRLALGATPRAACALVLRDGLALAATGLLIGLGAAMWLTRFMQTLLFEVSPLDQRVFASVILGLTAAAAAACAVPAAAATRVDPAIVLRDE